MSFPRRLLIGLSSLFLTLGSANAIEVGESLPNVSFPGSSGEPVTAKSQEGKVTLLNFWATWCAACKVELREFEDELAGRLSNPDLTVAYVSVDKDQKKAASWLTNHLGTKDILSRLYFDSKFAGVSALGIDAFPVTVVIGKDGKVHHIQRGFEEGAGTTAALVKTVDQLLH